MSLQEDLGRTIVRLRKEKGYSQEAFANEAGIDRRYMSDIENGKRNISIDILERVCNKLGIKISELFIEVEKAWVLYKGKGDEKEKTQHKSKGFSWGWRNFCGLSYRLSCSELPNARKCLFMEWRNVIKADG